MARPNGFSIGMSTTLRPRMCDICTSQESEGWIESLVSGIPQSDLCLECAGDASRILQAVRMAAARPVKFEKVAV